MSTVRNIAKNTAALFSSQIISYILLFFAAVYMARYLGTGGFGILSTALAISGIYAIFADLGLNTFTVREVSKDRSLSGKYSTNIFLMKVILAFLTLFITYLTVTLVHYPPETSLVIYIIIISTILTSFTGVFNSIFQAHEKMEYQSMSNILNGVIMFGIVWFAVHNNLGLITFAMIYLIASFIILVYSFVVYLLKFHTSKFEVDLKFWRPTITEAWPFGLSGLFAMVFVWVDSILLSIMVGTAPVGIYNASYRIITVLLFIPVIFNTVIFPLMSKFFDSEEQSLKNTLQKYFKLMLIIAIPMGVGITLLSDNIILLIFGSSYTGSIIALQILIWSTVFIFINSPFVQLMQAINRQLTLTKITAICMVENIILNLWLIPKFSYIAASWITVLTELTMLVLVFYVVHDIGYRISFKEVKDTVKITITSLAIGIFILYFKDLNFIIVTFISILLYLGVLYLIKIIDKEEIDLIKDILRIKREDTG